MPEVLEVEAYRRVAARTIGRNVTSVDAPDAWYIKAGADRSALSDALLGAVVTGVRRRGKLLMMDTDRRTVLGLRFGMTGRLVLEEAADGSPAEGPASADPVGRLLYSPGRDRVEHRRFGLGFAGGGFLVVLDPRRLGGVMLDPPVDDLGPDALELSGTDLRSALEGTRSPLKSALMDQRRIAGLGNLLTDDILWRARLSPQRPAGRLSMGDLTRLLGAVDDSLAELAARGGSHTGDLQPVRQRGAGCPRCGEPLRRDSIGGRTTYWCPAEQS